MRRPWSTFKLAKSDSFISFVCNSLLNLNAVNGLRLGTGDLDNGRRTYLPRREAISYTQYFFQQPIDYTRTDFSLKVLWNRKNSAIMNVDAF
jgi:hypothetical protein